MKHYLFACLASLLTIGASAQEFKYYLNGSNVKDSTFENFKNGDLLRVVFSNKTTNYNFRIATLLVTLVPVKNIGSGFAGNTTSFVLDNTTHMYTASPSFTVNLYERLSMLKHNEYNITVSVNQLIADTPEGEAWIRDNVKFEQIQIRKRMPDNSK